jgi:hypothetical protein
MTHTINVPLAEKVLGQILAAPKRWRQSVWMNRPYALEEQSAEDTVDNCATSGCFAGWTVVLAGHKTSASGWLDAPSDDLLAAIGEVYPPAEYGWRDDPAPASAREVATVELGLDAVQAAYLFEASNTLRDLYDYLAEWTEGEIVRPADLPEWADMTSDELGEYFYDQSA